MTDPVERRAARAVERCHCTHERAYHDSCSLCFCSFFLPSSEKDSAILKLWKAAKLERQAKEAH